MSPVMLDLLINAIEDTLLMTAISGLISLVAGLPLGLILVMTSPGGIAENRWVNRSLGLVINGFRSLPFIILLVALIPVTRFLIGTSLGVWAAMVPLSVTATPYFARVAEVSLRDVDRGLIDAVRLGRADSRGAAGHSLRFRGYAGGADWCVGDGRGYRCRWSGRPRHSLWVSTV
jgi:D-methionine transport system permease protein